MTSRVRDRHSSPADWSIRLSLLSVPILIIAAVGHRGGMMTAVETYAVVAVAFFVAALGVIASLGAFEAIWRDGRTGTGRAIRGLILGFVILAIPAFGAWRVVTTPRLVDISTDTDDPPEFVAVLKDRSPDDNPIADPTDDQADLQHDAYPDILPRHYPVGAPLVFDDTKTLVDQRGWRVLDAHRPDDADPTGSIEAVAASPLFGFLQDVVIRIAPDGDGTLVDMRSAARNGDHDLGGDASRIRDFFYDLDAALQGLSEQ